MMQHIVFMSVRKCTLRSLILITSLAILYIFITHDVFREAGPPSAVDLASSGSVRSAGAAPTEEAAAVFGRLQSLLQPPPAAQGSRCRHQLRLGGRCFLCRAHRVVGQEDSVVGQMDGAKPVCLDWLPRRNCSVLSFGINNDFSFDDAMAELGCSVAAFDPTMGRDSFRRSERVQFHSVGLGAADGRELGYPVVGLQTAARRAGLPDQPAIDYLKLDVEGSEWEVLTDTSQLSRVVQLACFGM